MERIVFLNGLIHNKMTYKSQGFF